MKGNLLSIGAARKHGITVEFGLENVLFEHNGTIVSTTKQHGSIYVIKSTNGRTAFQVQAYGKSANGLAASGTAGGGPCISGLTPDLVGTALEHGGGSNEAPKSRRPPPHQPPKLIAEVVGHTKHNKSSLKRVIKRPPERKNLPH